MPLTRPSFASCALALLLWPACTLANDALLTDFSHCDGRFFSAANSARLGAGDALTPAAEAGRSKAPKDLLTIKLTSPLNAAGLSFTQLQLSQLPLPGAGELYTWSLVAVGDARTALPALKPLLHGSKAAVSEPGTPLRLEVWQDGQWRSVSHLADDPQRIARLLVVDEGPTPGSLAVSCVLAGKLGAAQLAQLRPDLPPPPAPAPAKPAPAPSAVKYGKDSALPASVSASHAALLKALPALQPKFRELSYVLKQGEHETAVRVRANGALLHTEARTRGLELDIADHSLANLLVQRLSVGGYRPSTSLADEFAYTLPEQLADGASLTLKTRLADFPGDPHARLIERRCTQQASQPANSFDPALDGLARRLVCSDQPDDDGRVNRQEFLLIDSLGYAFNIGKDPAGHDYAISRLSISRGTR
ncbi:hypothetical protein [Chitinilyticum litopenaei]|uniref:hypothetical protein n=1 Tax=Chitinilyticum litopenaei TaxID=1121276 RepID=UPI000412A68E|nr:hypothetical protein [Chitinilyticum litopenaei]